MVQVSELQRFDSIFCIQKLPTIVLRKEKVINSVLTGILSTHSLCMWWVAHMYLTVCTHVCVPAEEVFILMCNSY